MAAEIRLVPLRTLDTVVTETPACFATSLRPTPPGAGRAGVGQDCSSSRAAHSIMHWQHNGPDDGVTERLTADIPLDLGDDLLADPLQLPPS